MEKNPSRRTGACTIHLGQPLVGCEHEKGKHRLAPEATKPRLSQGHLTAVPTSPSMTPRTEQLCVLSSE